MSSAATATTSTTTAPDRIRHEPRSGRATGSPARVAVLDPAHDWIVPRVPSPGVELAPSTAHRYLRHAFDQLLAVAERVGEPAVNERPHGPSTNTIAALVVHCCGVAEFWLGHVALGRPSERDREAELQATATIAEMRELVARTVAQADEDLAALDAGRGGDPTGMRRFLLDGDVSDGAVVAHVLEELYQHLGHAELTADALTLRDDTP